MLRTPLCHLLGIEAPILCAPFGPWDEVRLAAAVSNAGGLGALGTAVRPVAGLQEQWQRLRALTDRPFAINHTTRPFDEAAFAATLEAKPTAISFHLGDPGELVERAHDAGILWIQQVMDVDQARDAVDRGVDVIVAQGGEAGGHSGFVSTMVLVPQVVDVAGKIPVVAAGGIADGRGLAAALALGAQGVLMGTRFVASVEMGVRDEFKQLVVRSGAGDSVKAPFTRHLLPPHSRQHYEAVPRLLRNDFVDEWSRKPDDEAAREGPGLGPEIVRAVLAGAGDEYVPFGGQSAGLVNEVLPAAEIVRRVIEEAEGVLDRLPRPAALPAA